MRQPQVYQRSEVPASADAVWRRVVSPAGINHELGPFLRMTVPAPARGRGIDEFAAGERIGRSWLLLFGVVPFDYDDICLAELEPGRRFLEDSTMLSMRRWRHERTVEDRAGFTIVEDRVTFQPRAPLRWVPYVPRALEALVAAVFRHRHRRLRAHFDGSLC